MSIVKVWLSSCGGPTDNLAGKRKVREGAGKTTLGLVRQLLESSCGSNGYFAVAFVFDHLDCRVWRSCSQKFSSLVESPSAGAVKFS